MSLYLALCQQAERMRSWYLRRHFSGALLKLLTTQNNNTNITTQDKWRRISAIPIELSRENRSKHCSRINETWLSRYGISSPFTLSSAEQTFN
mmetsp:Transcript_1741/g.2656  ORF Transcript_1741/g.2656 Transcript_1741/m.2656 type:complete len:93 (-) Transcript_1741:36-314(-)